MYVDVCGCMWIYEDVCGCMWTLAPTQRVRLFVFPIDARAWITVADPSATAASGDRKRYSVVKLYTDELI